MESFLNVYSGRGSGLIIIAFKVKEKNTQERIPQLLKKYKVYTKLIWAVLSSYRQVEMYW